MKTNVIIQARMSSRRLPGKVLKLLNGRPLIGWTVETCKRVSNVDQVLVATSDDKSDDAIARWCGSNRIACVRGELNDVFARFVTACEKFPSDLFFRVNADSPLVNRHLFEQAHAIHSAEQLDLVTNIFPRTFPAGISVELIRTDSFLSFQGKLNAEEREHITQHFYRHSSQFRIKNIRNFRDMSGTHLAVDTVADYVKIKKLITNINGPPGEVSVSRLVTTLHNLI